MFSTGLMIFLCVVYAVIAVATLIEHDTSNWRALYMVGAILISVSIIMMPETK